MRPNSFHPLAAVTGSTFCNLALVLGLTTASAAAQDLDARVVIDPASATVTYDFCVTGPVRGFSVVAVAPKLSPIPRPIPPFGTAWLDPRMTMPLGVFPLDGSGQATGRIRMPATVIGKLNVCWQGITATSQLTNPRLTSWSSTSVKWTAKEAAGPSYAGSFQQKTSTYDYKMLNLPAGANVSIAFNNTPADATKANANGTAGGSFKLGRAPQHGDLITIYVNNQVYTRFRY